MSMLLWIDESADKAIDLGDPFAAWRNFAEMARAAPGEEYPELYGVPHMAEQTINPDWLAKVKEQATIFLSRHGGKLSGGAKTVLETLIHGEG